MKKLFILGAFLLISACSTSTTHLSVIVPADVNLDLSSLNNRIVTPNVTGENTKYIFLFFPLGQPSFTEAVNATLKNGYGQILTNATVVDRTKWFVLFGYSQIEITADVVNLE